ncbi:MAG: NAD-dependent epimerase/dehydratase family protein [bacterium]
MKVFITGGAGFIGSNIAEELQKNNEVTVFDNLRTGFGHNLEGLNVNFIKGDICDLEAVRGATRNIDTIFHLAAFISVPESMAKEEETVRINAIGSLNVLKAARENKVRNIVLSSSAAVYGDSPVSPKREDMIPEPKSPYAVTKLDGEFYFKMYREEYGINAVCLRYFNVFGPRQDPKSQYAAAIPIFVGKALKNEDLIIYGDGEQTRDFVYVKDVVKANLLAAQKGGTIYNVAGGNTITVNELAEKIIKITNSKSRIVYVPDRPGDIKHSHADISRIRKIGFEPGTDLSAGLEKTIAYFISLFGK